MRYEYFPIRKFKNEHQVYSRRRGTFGVYHADLIAGFPNPEDAEAIKGADTVGQLIRVDYGPAGRKIFTFALPTGMELQV
jgi:hypothetical protein